MTVSAKRRGAFVQAAFEILIQAGGRLPRKEIERRVQARFELDEFERSPVPGRNRTQFEVALYRAMNPSSFVGWIKRNHGEWILTEKGSDALAAHPRAPELFEASKRLRRAMRQGATAEPEESRLYEGVEMDYSGKDTTLFTREFASVQQLVAAVEQGTLGLPDIQRPFVWSSAKVRDLLDSMYQGFPVGYLLSWANPGGSGSRQIGSGEHGTAHSTALIIDGQQRLTSLYAVMTGKAILDEQFQQRRIHIAFHPLQARFEVADAAIRKSPEWIADIASLFGSGRGSYQVVSEYLGTLKSVRDLTDDQRRIIAANLERLLQLSKYEFGILRISAETDEEQVADIFVRVNSKGQNLKQSDFILTLLSVFWEQGREQLESFSQACVQRPGPGSAPSPFNHHFHPGPDDLLRVGIALGLRRARLRAAYQVLRGKDAVTESYSQEVRQLNLAALQRAQSKVLDLIHWHEFLKCLMHAGFRGVGQLQAKGNVLYSYVFYLIGRDEFGVATDRMRRLIARFFSMATLTGRYSMGAPESAAEQDLARLRGISDGEGFIAVLEDLLGSELTTNFWKSTLPVRMETSNTRSLSAFHAAQCRLGTRALFSELTVADLMDPSIATPKKGVELHHLFPKNWLRGRGIDGVRETNQIANFALVEWSDNIAISDQGPRAYAPEFSARYSNEQLSQVLRSHALPEAWFEMEYGEFLKVRRHLMSELMRESYEGL